MTERQKECQLCKSNISEVTTPYPTTWRKESAKPFLQQNISKNEILRSVTQTPVPPDEFSDEELIESQKQQLMREGRTRSRENWVTDYEELSTSDEDDIIEIDVDPSVFLPNSKTFSEEDFNNFSESDNSTSEEEVLVQMKPRKKRQLSRSPNFSGTSDFELSTDSDIKPRKARVKNLKKVLPPIKKHIHSEFSNFPKENDKMKTHSGGKEPRKQKNLKSNITKSNFVERGKELICNNKAINMNGFKPSNSRSTAEEKRRHHENRKKSELIPKIIITQAESDESTSTTPHIGTVNQGINRKKYQYKNEQKSSGAPKDNNKCFRRKCLLKIRKESKKGETNCEKESLKPETCKKKRKIGKNYLNSDDGSESFGHTDIEELFSNDEELLKAIENVIKYDITDFENLSLNSSESDFFEDSTKNYKKKWNEAIPAENEGTESDEFSGSNEEKLISPSPSPALLLENETCTLIRNEKKCDWNAPEEVIHIKEHVAAEEDTITDVENIDVEDEEHLDKKKSKQVPGKSRYLINSEKSSSSSKSMFSSYVPDRYNPKEMVKLLCVERKREKLSSKSPEVGRFFGPKGK